MDKLDNETLKIVDNNIEKISNIFPNVMIETDDSTN